MTEQRNLFQYSEAFSQLDPRVRSTFIDGEQFVSALDLLAFHGNKKNPSQAWKTTLEFMERQGALSDELNPFYGEHQFEGIDGIKRKPTPIINLDGFLRFVQKEKGD